MLVTELSAGGVQLSVGLAAPVVIASAEQAKIISGNIRSGVTILGVAGASAVVDTSGGDATAAQILSGRKAYVAGALVTGSLTAAAVSQDSTSKVLTIS